MSGADADRKAFYREARTDLTGPLDGVRVIEVATTWAGPRCGALLADLGADVIKVECPSAPDVARRLTPILSQCVPPTSYVNAAVNRNKRNVAVELRRPEGRDIFLRLVQGADIVVENMRPGTMAAWGCAYDDARAKKPAIIYVSISGFGQFGPNRERPGYDPIAQAVSGVMWLNGEHDGSPLKSPIFLADELAALHGALSAVAALRHRDLHGEGQHIDVSLLDAMIASSTGIPTLAAQGEPTPRWGNTFGFAAPSNAYCCRDGWVYAGALLDSHWRKLAAVLGRPELATDERYATLPARLARRDELDEMLGAWCRERTRSQVAAALAEAGLTAAAVLTPAEMVDDPHVRARGTISSVRQSSGGEVQIEGPAAKLSRTPLGVRSPAPELGAHTTNVLDSLGIDRGRQQELRAAGVIA